VGLETLAAAAAVRAGISAYREVPFHDLDGRPVIAAPVPRLATAWAGAGRLVSLLSRAVRECLDRSWVQSPRRLGVHVVLPEAGRPDGLPGIERAIEADLSPIIGAWGQWSTFTSSRLGRAGGVLALEAAHRAFQDGTADAFLLAGVDSFVNGADLAHFDRQRRLKTESNPDGFVPGEGAAAVLLCPWPGRHDGRPVEVSGWGTAHEPAVVGSDGPNRSVGLAAAIRAAIEDAGTSMAQVDFRYADLNGEQFGFREVANAMSRVVRERRERIPLFHPADCVGEVGAAAGPLLLALCADALARKHAPGNVGMVLTGADGGERAAAILQVEA